MNSTGIVRRMDDLGRLIVPMAVRKAIGVKEGDLFEIFIDIENKTVSFRRCSENYITKEAEEN